MKILGSHMGTYLQRQVLNQFVYRFTGEHKPAWANKEWKDGKPYPLQFKDDSDWLAHTYFEVTVKGEISKRNNYCESNPTWPNNPELR